jgi:hypothetical protein
MKTIIFFSALLSFSAYVLADELTVKSETQGSMQWTELARHKVYFEDASSPTAAILQTSRSNPMNVVSHKEDADVIVKSYYAATSYLAKQRGGIGSTMSEQDVLQGKAPDRFHFKLMQCQEPREYLTGPRIFPVGDSMAEIHASGAGISNGTEVGITLIAGLLDIFLPAKKEVDCDKTFIVCPLSASFCPFDEYIITEAIGIKDGTTGKYFRWITTKTSSGNGFNGKLILDKHLKFLSSTTNNNDTKLTINNTTTDQP